MLENFRTNVLNNWPKETIRQRTQTMPLAQRKTEVEINKSEQNTGLRVVDQLDLNQADLGKAVEFTNEAVINCAS